MIWRRKVYVKRRLQWGAGLFFLGVGLIVLFQNLVMPDPNSQTWTPTTLKDESGHDHHVSPVAEEYFTHEAISSSGVGRWSDSATWRAAANVPRVPTDHAVVLIPKGQTVVFDQAMSARVSVIDVQGTLRFAADVPSVQLNVETVIVQPGGKFLIGTPTAPATNNVRVVFIDRGEPVYPTDSDPEALRRGLIAMGAVRIYGEPKPPFVRLPGRKYPKGTTSFSVAGRVPYWIKGDEVLIPSTHFRQLDVLQNEVRSLRVNAVDILDLSDPTSFDHGVDPSMTYAIGNLTRKIVFTSGSSGVARRGHVMLMDCTNSYVQGAAFVGLGRTDKLRPINEEFNPSRPATFNPRGRYALHFHDCGLDQGAAVVRNSVVRDVPGWGIVNHGSRVNIRDNVVFDYGGAGIVAENGDEIGVVDGNLTVGGRGLVAPDPANPNKVIAQEHQYPIRRNYLSDSPRMRVADFAYHGDGFWMQSPMVSVTNNISAGNRGAGFNYHTVGLTFIGTVGVEESILAAEYGGALNVAKLRRWRDSRGNPSTRVVVQDIPLKKFANNDVYGSFIGVKPRYIQVINDVAYTDFGNTRYPESQGGMGRRTFEMTKEITPATSNYFPMSFENNTVLTEAYVRHTMSGIKAWNNSIGVQPTYSNNLDLIDVFVGTDEPEFVVNCDPALASCVWSKSSCNYDTKVWIGIEANHGSLSNGTLTNATIKGYPIGMVKRTPPEGGAATLSWTTAPTVTLPTAPVGTRAPILPRKIIDCDDSLTRL